MPRNNTHKNSSLYNRKTEVSLIVMEAKLA